MDDRPHKAFPDGEFTEAELKALGNINALSNQEAKIVLKQFLDKNRKADSLWKAPGLADKAFEYLKKVEEKTDVAHSDSVQRLREVVLAADIHEFEMALLANLTPETALEAMTLIPSLQDEQRFPGEDGKLALQNVLDEIITLKELQ